MGTLPHPGRSATDLINHSCEPNADVLFMLGMAVVKALRSIDPGEEITTDYAKTSPEGWRMECNCGRRRCRGVVEGRRPIRAENANGGGKVYKFASSVVIETTDLPDGSSVTLQWDKHSWGTGGSGFAFYHSDPPGEDNVSRSLHKSRPYPASEQGKMSAIRAFKRYVARKRAEMKPKKEESPMSGEDEELRGLIRENGRPKFMARIMMTTKQASSWVRCNCKFAQAMRKDFPSGEEFNAWMSTMTKDGMGYWPEKHRQPDGSWLVQFYDQGTGEIAEQFQVTIGAAQGQPGQPGQPG